MAHTSMLTDTDPAPAPAYDPFARGPHPVGVQTLDVADGRGDGAIRVEVWYPATADAAGADLDRRRQDRFPVLAVGPRWRQAAVRELPPAEMTGLPLVIFSHGLGGFRRQSTFLTTHLASHGYLVIAPDHRGSTLADMVARRRAGGDAVRHVLSTAADVRLTDVPRLIDAFTAELPAYAERVDAGCIGMAGHSFGGWTTVGVTSAPSRIGCALALAPIGRGRNRVFGDRDAYDQFEVTYSGRPPTLILAAERDSLCRLHGVERLHRVLGGAHRLVVIANADHLHFCDNARQAHRAFASILGLGRTLHISRLRITRWRELLAQEPAHDAIRGAGLAHFDAHLKGTPGAAAFLDSVIDACGTRGAAVSVRAASA